MVAVARPDVNYPLLARNEREGLFTWYLIQYDEDTVGWSSGRYLFVEGDENVLPYADSVFPTLPVEEYMVAKGEDHVAAHAEKVRDDCWERLPCACCSTVAR